MTRRKAISSSAGIVAGVVLGGVIGGTGGYLAGQAGTPGPKVSATQTVTVTSSGTVTGASKSGTFAYLDVQGSRFSVAHDAVSDVFQKRYPGINLVRSPQSLQNWLTNTGIQLASGDAKFDYFETLYQNISGWASAGYLEPLDDYINSDDPDI